MRSIRAVRGLVAGGFVAVMIAVAPAGAAVAGEPAEGWDPAAVALAEDWHIPIEEAQARIERQEASVALAEEARRVFGSRFGGAYIDHARGGALVVGFTGATASAELDRLAGQHGLRGHTIGATVRYSQDQLDAALATLRRGLAEVNAGATAPVMVALRPDANAVELTQPADGVATSAQRSYLAWARASYGAMLLPVVSNEAPEPATFAGLANAALVANCGYPSCGPPLRGGFPIFGGGTCTAGFMTKSNVDNKKYVLTAGHCLRNSTTTWETYDDNWARVDIGERHNRVFGAGGDMGIIRVDDPGYWQPKGWVYVSWSPGPYPTTTNAEYTIGGTGYSSAIVGEYLCKTGQTTYTNCGEVKALNQTVHYGGSVDVTVHGLGRVDMLTCKGDSGGPLYVQHVAYGVVSGVRLWPNSDKCGDITWYQGINGALDAMNVHLLPA
jgi:streptogrisin C